MTSRLRSLFIGSLAILVILTVREAMARQEPLLDFAKGQMPNDTGSDGATTYSIEDSKELGGKVLKVVFAAGDSVGVRSSRVKNWKPYVSLEFEAFNPASETVNLIFTVKHKRSTNLATRIDVPIALKPGKNSIKIGIDEMLNTNGSAPDLANVVRWYFACEAGKTPTVDFGSIWLVGDDTPAAAATAAAGPASAPAGEYRITGKIGDMNVDLKLTPQANSNATPAAEPPAADVSMTGDPARLARIRAAKMPTFAKPVDFFTPEADAICSALEIFPPDNPWNAVVSNRPVHPNSRNMIASIGLDKPLRYNADMGFVLVPPGQKRIPVKLGEYSGESDKGPYPVPDNMPIEGWPGFFQRDAASAALSLDDVQRDRQKQGGDRHAIVVDPVNRILYEFYAARKTDHGWEAAGAAIFDLKSNQLRPDGWTSTDAAGLPIFPSVVRYDEIQRGAIEHALRVTIRKSRRAYVAPATHYASPHEDENLPRMGERLRLRQDFDVSGFSAPAQTILKALKKYGMFVADNGIEWAISVAPDPRIPPLAEELRKVKGSDFEVVTPVR